MCKTCHLKKINASFSMAASIMNKTKLLTLHEKVHYGMSGGQVDSDQPAHLRSLSRVLPFGMHYL